MAYQRLKAYGEEEGLMERSVVIRNGALSGTSAWANTFLSRDHHAHGQGKEMIRGLQKDQRVPDETE